MPCNLYNLSAIPRTQVKSDLHGWVAHFNQQVDFVRGRAGCRLRDLELALIARGLLGRPDFDPNGPTYFDVLPPLLRTDTKKHEDIHKIMAHTEEEVARVFARSQAAGTVPDGLQPDPTPDDAVIIDVSDGQAFKLQGHSKKRAPQRYAL